MRHAHFAAGLLVSLTAMGCSSSAGKADGPTDGALAEVDLGAPGPDAAQAPPDLARPDLSPDPLKTFQYASRAFQLPGAMLPASIDIDGDGKLENRFATLVQTLSNLGVPLQATVDIAVAEGSLVDLFALRQSDTGDTPVGSLAVVPATPRKAGDPPKYDGSDVFVADAGAPPASLVASVTGGKLATTVPSKLGRKDAQQLLVTIPLGAASIRFNLSGVHVQATVSPGGLMSGEIHGVVSKQDLDTRVVPDVANYATLYINANPGTAEAKTMIALLEDASGDKCTMTPTKCCHTNPTTCVITPDEVAGSGVIKGILAPDVQVFSGSDWVPVPAGTKKDALSFGIGFTAVKAKF